MAGKRPSNSEFTKRQDVANEHLRQLVDLHKGEEDANKTQEWVQEEIKNELVELNDKTKTAPAVSKKWKLEIKQKVLAFRDMVGKWVKPLTNVFSHIGSTMLSHFREGFQKAVGYLKGHLTTILEPISEITGPLMAVGAGLFKFGKSLFGVGGQKDKDSKNLKTLADNSTKTLDDQRRAGDVKDAKPKGFLKFLLPIAALLLGFFGSVIKDMSLLLKPFISFGKMIMDLPFLKNIKKSKFLGKIFGFFGKLSKIVKAAPFSKILGVFGKIIGKFFVPLLAVWEIIKAAMGEGSIQEKIITGISGILSIFTEIPEFIANAVLSLFTDFRVDFSADAIKDSIYSLIDWFKTTVIDWVVEMFTVTIPEMFKSFSGGFQGLADKALNFGGMVKDMIIDFLIDILGDAPLIGSYVRDLANLKSTPTVGGAGVTKSTPTMTRVNGVEMAQAHATTEQTRVGRETVGAIGETTRGVNENTNVNRQNIQNQQNITVNEKAHDEMPSDPENMGVMLMNKSWGLGGT